VPTLLPVGIELVKRWETFAPTAYLDHGGHWAIGYGHSTIGLPEVKEGDVWTEEYASEVLKTDLELVGKRLLKLVTVPLNDYQFSALCSVGYNTGVSGLLRSEAIRLLHDKTITYPYEKCALALVDYAVSAKDKITGIRRDFLGLKIRRITEAALFLTKVST
jgi:lysozyme